MTTKATKTHELRTINPGKLKLALRHAFLRRRPLFIWGSPGVGKSDIIAQIGIELNRPVIDIRLLLQEPTDIRGIPYLDPTDNKMKWSDPADLPTDKFSNAIVFFDEMNAAPQSVQAASYQIILNRRIGQYRLPDNCVMVAAGNKDTDKAVTNRMPSALANRFVHVTLEVDFDDWQEWALTNRVHKDVVGYLTFQKQDLHSFDPQNASRAFPTPRSWYFTSELLSDSAPDGSLVDTNLPEDILADLVVGCVGEGPGAKFMTYRKQAANLPNPSDILSGKVKDLKEKNVGIMYALTTGLCYELQDIAKKAQEANAGSDKGKAMGDFQDKFDLFLRFMMDNFVDELTIMGAKTALQVYKLPVMPLKLKNWKEFSDAYSEIIIAA